MKPYIQFFTGDWQRDSALRVCSMAARGLWIEMLCIMHQAEPYGHLVVNGKPLSPEILARMVGCSPTECKRWLAELEDAGVFDRDAGVIFSRRMVRDERIRQSRADGGKLGGNPKLMDKPEVAQKDEGKVNHKVNHTPNDQANHRVNDPPNDGVNPHIQFSEVINKNTPKPPRSVPDLVPGFVAFWAAWPPHKRKADKLGCLRKWHADDCESRTAEILEKLAAWRKSEDWRDDGGRYVPAPLVWLSQRRYEAEAPSEMAAEGVEMVNGQARIGRFVA
jgi:DNA-binding Lrp family transcriptional regulator